MNNTKKTYSIDLSDQGLTQIPEKLRERFYIEEVNLANNNLQNLPHWFCSISGLKVLNLKNNQFTTVPQTICKAENLYSLDLRSNPISKLPRWLISAQFSDLKIEDTIISANLELLPDLIFEFMENELADHNKPLLQFIRIWYKLRETNRVQFQEIGENLVKKTIALKDVDTHAFEDLSFLLFATKELSSTFYHLLWEKYSSPDERKIFRRLLCQIHLVTWNLYGIFDRLREIEIVEFSTNPFLIKAVQENTEPEELLQWLTEIKVIMKKCGVDLRENGEMFYSFLPSELVVVFLQHIKIPSLSQQIVNLVNQIVFGPVQAKGYLYSRQEERYLSLQKWTIFVDNSKSPDDLIRIIETLRLNPDSLWTDFDYFFAPKECELCHTKCDNLSSRDPRCCLCRHPDADSYRDANDNLNYYWCSDCGNRIRLEKEEEEKKKPSYEIWKICGSIYEYVCEDVDSILKKVFLEEETVIFHNLEHIISRVRQIVEDSPFPAFVVSERLPYNNDSKDQNLNLFFAIEFDEYEANRKDIYLSPFIDYRGLLLSKDYFGVKEGLIQSINWLLNDLGKQLQDLDKLIQQNRFEWAIPISYSINKIVICHRNIVYEPKKFIDEERVNKRIEEIKHQRPSLNPKRVFYSAYQNPLNSSTCRYFNLKFPSPLQSDSYYENLLVRKVKIRTIEVALIYWWNNDQQRIKEYQELITEQQKARAKRSLELSLELKPLIREDVLNETIPRDSLTIQFLFNLIKEEHLKQDSRFEEKLPFNPPIQVSDDQFQVIIYYSFLEVVGFDSFSQEGLVSFYNKLIPVFKRLRIIPDNYGLNVSYINDLWNLDKLELGIGKNTHNRRLNFSESFFSRMNEKVLLSPISLKDCLNSLRLGHALYPPIKIPDNQLFCLVYHFIKSNTNISTSNMDGRVIDRQFPR